MPKARVESAHTENWFYLRHWIEVSTNQDPPFNIGLIDVSLSGARDRDHDRRAGPDGLGRRHHNVFQPLGQNQNAHTVPAGLQRHATQSARNRGVHCDQLVPKPNRTRFLLFTGRWWILTFSSFFSPNNKRSSRLCVMHEKIWFLNPFLLFRFLFFYFFNRWYIFYYFNNLSNQISCNGCRKSDRSRGVNHVSIVRDVNRYSAYQLDTISHQRDHAGITIFFFFGYRTTRSEPSKGT